MSSHFEARTDSPLIRSATLAFVNTLLDELMPHLCLAARGCGYALAVHGSRRRDIDIIAVPWTDHADSAELLVARLCGVLAGHVGRAISSAKWADKPHGRRAVTIILPGMCPEIDLSIMPLVAEPQP